MAQDSRPFADNKGMGEHVEISQTSSLISGYKPASPGPIYNTHEEPSAYFRVYHEQKFMDGSELEIEMDEGGHIDMSMRVQNSYVHYRIWPHTELLEIMDEICREIMDRTECKIRTDVTPRTVIYRQENTVEKTKKELHFDTTGLFRLTINKKDMFSTMYIRPDYTGLEHLYNMIESGAAWPHDDIQVGY